MQWPNMRKALDLLAPMPDAEYDLFCSFAKPRHIPKKKFLFTQGDICRWVGFVQEGCLRYYMVDNSAEERILYFAMEGWWIGDLASFNHGGTSLYNLQALTDVDLLLFERETFAELCRLCPTWEKLYRIGTQKAYAAMHDRFIQFQSMSSEEKYLQLIKKSPSLFQRVPQHFIASYLGIKPQSLSRIRKKLDEDGIIACSIFSTSRPQTKEDAMEKLVVVFDVKGMFKTQYNQVMG